MIYILGVFIVLHGLVHLLYFGQSQKYFELQPGLAWPDGSWAFTGLLGSQGTRSLASVVLVLVAIGFVGSIVALVLKQPWWRQAVTAAAALSTVLYLLTWDGKLVQLPEKGGVGILINIALIVLVLVLGLPKTGF